MSAPPLGELVDFERYEDWQREIIYERKHYKDQDSDAAVARRRSVANRQAQLAEAVGSGLRATAEYLFEALGVDNHDQVVGRVPNLPNPLTEGEMSQLPAHAERELALKLHESLSPAEAAQPAVWTLCHAVWIAEGNFGRNLATVFCEGPKASTVEARTRNFLRKTGGLRRVRGNTSPLVDCQIAAAWWRYRIACEASATAVEEGADLTVDAAHQTLRPRDVWENLVTMSLKRVTAVCAPRARAAAVVAFSQHCHDPGEQVTRAQVQRAIRELARLGHSHSLWQAPWDALVDAATRGISNASDAEVIDDDQEAID